MIAKALGIALVCAIFGANLAFANPAQLVPIPEDENTAPQLEIDAVGIATAGGKSVINFADSALQIGAAQRLFDGQGVGSFSLGGVTTDESNRGLGTGFFLHRALLDLQWEKFEVLIGRADNSTAHLVDFPTLREDDLITMTNPLDPFSDGSSAEEHRYSNVASVTLNQGLKYFENIHAQQLIASASPGAHPGINSIGGIFQYLASPGMEPFERLPSWGMGYEFLVPTASLADGLHQIYAGGILNLNESVTHRWDLRAQDILSVGSRLRSLSSASDALQANSNSLAASIRFLHNPFGMPGYQIALTGAYKNYLDVSSERSAGAALTLAKRLGSGFDLVAQYQGQWRSGALAGAQAGGKSYEQTAEMGLIFSFETTFNQHLSPRRRLLNQEHLYLPN